MYGAKHHGSLVLTVHNSASTQEGQRVKCVAKEQQKEQKPKLESDDQWQPSMEGGAYNLNEGSEF